MKQRLGRGLVALVAVLLSGVPALAAGFSFFEQGAKASGQAGAWIARADDASANWYNPAALVRLSGGEVEFGLNYLEIGSQTNFTINDPAAQGISGLLGVTVTAGQKFDATSNVATPAHFYYGQKINPKWAFGVGINNPFGLKSEWTQIPMTLSSRKADLVTYEVNPNIAYAFNDSWSIGLGVDYLAAELHTFSHDAFVATPASTTLLTNLTGEGDAWGYNFAFQYKSPCFAVGASYRSELNPEIRGRIRIDSPTGAQVIDAKSKVDLPSEVYTGVAWISDRADVEFAATYMKWNDFKELSIETPVAPPSKIAENWDSVWAYRIGGAFRFDKNMVHEVRIGYVRDDSPIPTDFLRPSIPDSDRTGYTLGYGYKGKKWAIDAYAMDLKFDDVVATGDFVTDGVIKGKYASSIWLAGVTGTIRF